MELYTLTNTPRKEKKIPETVERKLSDVRNANLQLQEKLRNQQVIQETML